MTVRKAAVAGGFYPAEKGMILAFIKKFLSDAKDVQINGRLHALVEPHAGYVYSGPIAAYGYKLLQKHQAGIKKIILLGPSHHAGFSGVAESGFDYWETPLGKVKVGSIAKKVEPEFAGLFSVIQEAHAPEHCLEVQIPFLQTVMKNKFEIFPLLLGDVNYGQLARALVSAIDDSALIIASSDLSHYLQYGEAIKRDSVANEAIPALDIQKFTYQGDACGKGPILTLMHVAKLKGWNGKFLDYRNSGDTAGNRIQVVGYGCYAFYR
ncbi:MAG: AmmeMemoRadiSam system protein B [Candidatus Micrarchaeota archaeon]